MLDDVNTLIATAKVSLTNLAEAANNYIEEFDSYLEDHQVELLGEPDLDLTKKIILRKIIGTLNERH